MIDGADGYSLRLIPSDKILGRFATTHEAWRAVGRRYRWRKIASPARPGLAPGQWIRRPSVERQNAGIPRPIRIGPSGGPPPLTGPTSALTCSAEWPPVRPVLCLPASQ